MQTAAEGKFAEQNVLCGAKLKSMGFTDSAELDRRRASMARTSREGSAQKSAAYQSV
jgi:hypothetical protein